MYPASCCGHWENCSLVGEAQPGIESGPFPSKGCNTLSPFCKTRQVRATSAGRTLPAQAANTSTSAAETSHTRTSLNSRSRRGCAGMLPTYANLRPSDRWIARASEEHQQVCEKQQQKQRRPGTQKCTPNRGPRAHDCAGHRRPWRGPETIVLDGT